MVRAELRTARLEREYTQQELADRLGISRVHLNNIELGRSNASGRVAWEMMQHLGISPLSVTRGGRND